MHFWYGCVCVCVIECVIVYMYLHALVETVYECVRVCIRIKAISKHKQNFSLKIHHLLLSERERERETVLF